MSIFEVLSDILPCVYSASTEKVPPPYLAYRGNGQTNFSADDTYYYTQNNYIVEYYFVKKDPYTEQLIEQRLLENGYRYEKSEDIQLSDEGVNLIYYYI